MSPPLESPTHPSGLSQGTRFTFCVIQQIPTGYLFYIW